MSHMLYNSDNVKQWLEKYDLKQFGQYADFTCQRNSGNSINGGANEIKFKAIGELFSTFFCKNRNKIVPVVTPTTETEVLPFKRETKLTDLDESTFYHILKHLDAVDVQNMRVVTNETLPAINAHLSTLRKEFLDDLHVKKKKIAFMLNTLYKNYSATKDAKTGSIQLQIQIFKKVKVQDKTFCLRYICIELDPYNKRIRLYYCKEPSIDTIKNEEVKLALMSEEATQINNRKQGVTNIQICNPNPNDISNDCSFETFSKLVQGLSDTEIENLSQGNYFVDAFTWSSIVYSLVSSAFENNKYNIAANKIYRKCIDEVFAGEFLVSKRMNALRNNALQYKSKQGMKATNAKQLVLVPPAPPPPPTTTQENIYTVFDSPIFGHTIPTNVMTDLLKHYRIKRNPQNITFSEIIRHIMICINSQDAGDEAWREQFYNTIKEWDMQFPRGLVLVQGSTNKYVSSTGQSWYRYGSYIIIGPPPLSLKAVGGRKQAPALVKSKQKIKYKQKQYIIYLGKRGGKYIKLQQDKFVLVSKLLSSNQL